jgi:hypothetical protein
MKIVYETNSKLQNISSNLISEVARDRKSSTATRSGASSHLCEKEW